MRVLMLMVAMLGCTNGPDGPDEGIHEQVACESDWGEYNPPTCEAACTTQSRLDIKSPCVGATNAKFEKSIQCTGTFSASGERGCCAVDVDIAMDGHPTAKNVLFFVCP